jgi:hypothetical protein
MVKRLTLLMAAVAALACAIPALANASSVTSSPGTLTPVGTPIALTGTDITTQSPTLGNITCQTLTPIIELTKNAGGIFEGFGGNATPAQSGCINGTKTVKVTTFRITNLVSTSSGTGSMSYISEQDIAGVLTCTFTGTSVPFSYTVGANVIKFSAAAGIVGSPSATCGSTAKLTGEFRLDLSLSGKAVILD